MNKSIKKLIKENNEKRNLLDEENKTYYENFLMYVRSTFLKDERATEEVLLEMLDHLLLAQDEGKGATDVFGKNPQELADEVIESLPRESFKHLFTFGIELILTVLAFYTVVRGVATILMKEAKIIYLGNVLIIGAVIVATLALLIYVVFVQLKKDVFKEGKQKKFYFPIFFVIFIGSIVIALCTVMLPNIGREIHLGQYGVFSIACVLLLVTFIMKKIREQR